jgi:DNA mismatch repair protein MutH
VIAPPRDEAELVTRAMALVGRTLGEIAAEVGVALDGPTVRTKGKMGTVLERALGASAGSAAVPDFPTLGIELKSIPVDERGTPREGTFVTSIDLSTLDREVWETSRVRGKLTCVLWVPVLTPGDTAPALRRVGRPRLWRPTASEELALRGDWEDLVGKMAIGGIESLSAHDGEILQVRPKAAHGGVRAEAPGHDGETLLTVPRGFYLRARFTAGLIRP